MLSLDDLREQVNRLAVPAGTHPEERRGDLDGNERRAQLEQHQAGVFARMEQLMDGARDADRALLASEARQYDRLERDWNDITALIDRNKSTEVRPDPNTMPGTIAHQAGRGRRTDTVLLRREERMADAPGTPTPSDSAYTDLSLGRCVRGIVTGDWSNADAERRAMSEGVLAQGGHTVPSPLATEIIDLARRQARVFQAGALTLPMTSSTQKVARQASDPTAAWHAENAPTTESQLTFEAVEFTARTLRCVVRVSLELLEDNIVNLDNVIRSSFAQAFALELDRAALRGSGTAPEPRGVRFQTGVTITELGAGNGATPADFDDLSSAIQTLRLVNAEPSGVILSPRTEGTYGRLKDSTGQPLQATADVAALPRYPTTQVPTNLTVGTSTDTSEVYVADWSQLWVGIRTQFAMIPLRERYLSDAADGSGGQFGFFAYLRADVQLAQPGHFAVLTGVRP